MDKEKEIKIGKSKWLHLVVYSILSFALFLPVTAHATEKINRAADSYTVKLPKSVDVSKNSTTFDVLVENNENHNVYISMDPTVSLKNEKKPTESVPLQVSFANNVKFGVNERKTATLTHEDLSAGKWNANLNVNIRAEANTYTFKFDGNGATSGTMADMPSSFGKEFILPECAFTKEYYTFEHYNLYKIENGVRKYYYVKNGTSEDSSESRSWYEKEKAPTGWTLSIPKPGNNLYSKVYNIKDGETLYVEAQWKKNTVTLNYHANGGTRYDGDTPLETKDIIATSELDFDYVTGVYGLGSFTDGASLDMKKDGYHHPGSDKEWLINSTSSGLIQHGEEKVAYKDIAEKAGKGEQLKKGNVTVDLYANWQINTGTMHFYPNGGNNKGYEGSTIVGSGEYAGSLSWTQGFNYHSTSGNTVVDVLTLFERPGYHRSSTQAWHLGSANASEFIKDQDEDLSRFVKDKTNVHLKLYANWIPNTWTVKYDSNGGTGTMADTTHTYAGGVKVRPNAFTKTGYTFDGWYASRVNKGKTEWLYGNSKIGWADQWYEEGKQPEGLVKYRFGNEEHSNITTYINNDVLTLHAQWKANTYTYNIKYVSSSGKSLGTSTVKGTYGSSTTVSAPDKAGYTTPTSQTVKFDSVNAKTITFTYTPVTYSITYNLAGGSVSGNPTSYNIESAAITLKNPTRTGYTFTGWTGSNGTTASTSVSIPSGSTGNKSYTANWKINTYTLTYNANGGSVTPASKSLTYGSQYGTLPTPTRTGYTFNGWYTAASGGTKVSSTTTMGAGNKTIYAQWSVNTYTYNIKYVSSSGKSLGTSTVKGTYGSSTTVSAPDKAGYTTPTSQTVKFDSVNAKTITFTYTPVTYSITYNLAGGSVSGNPTSYNIESAAITLKNPTRTGYTFTGWTGSNGTTASTSVSIPSGSTGNKSYTANWKINTYTLTYNANGGSVTPASKSLTYGSQYGTLPTPTRTGYTFNGWYTAASGGTKVSSTTTMGAGNKTIYAQWSVNTYTYNIKYVSSSGKSLGTSTVKGTYGSSTTVSAPDKAGYTTPTSQTVKFDSVNAKTITFTYTPVTYSITYNLAGGSVSGNPTSYNIESAAITLKNPTRTGYTFTGWTGSNGTTASTSVSIPSGSTGNKSYTANWKINTYTLTYNANGGSVTPASKSLTYGSQYGTLPTPTRTGYTFNGWYTAASGGTKVSSTTTMGAGNKIIYAQWTKNITYELVDGPTFNDKMTALMNKHLSVAEWEIIFTDQKTGGTLIHDFDKDGDGGIVAWVVESELIKAPMKGTVYISTQKAGQKVIANEDCTDMFYLLSKVTSIHFNNLFDTSKVTNMSGMFWITGNGTTTNFEIKGLENWNTSNVTDMSYMFSRAGEQATTWDIGDLSNWDTSNVTDMSAMFSNAGINATTWDIGDLSNWNTSNVTDMNFMFSLAGNDATTWDIGDLSNWDTSNVTDMNAMFQSVGFNAVNLEIKGLENWNTSNVTDMSYMFSRAGEQATTFDIGDLSNWDTSNVTDMSYMFRSAGQNATTWSVGDLSNWDTSKLTDMSYMFSLAGKNATNAINCGITIYTNNRLNKTTFQYSFKKTSDYFKIYYVSDTNKAWIESIIATATSNGSHIVSGGLKN